MDEASRGSEVRDIRGLMRETLEEAGMPGLEALLPVRERWGEVVGEEASRKTKPYRLEEGKLYIGVESHAWVQEAHFMRETIKVRLKELLGIDVQDVVIRKINVK